MKLDTKTNLQVAFSFVSYAGVLYALTRVLDNLASILLVGFVSYGLVYYFGWREKQGKNTPFIIHGTAMIWTLISMVILFVGGLSYVVEAVGKAIGD